MSSSDHLQNLIDAFAVKGNVQIVIEFCITEVEAAIKIQVWF